MSQNDFGGYISISPFCKLSVLGGFAFCKIKLNFALCSFKIILEYKGSYLFKIEPPVSDPTKPDSRCGQKLSSVSEKGKFSFVKWPQ